MTRDLIIKTKSSVRRYALGKDIRPLTAVGQRLYRTDEHLMMSARDSDDDFVMYDIDQTRPYFLEGCAGLIASVSPDVTMAYIDVAKQAGTGVGRVSWLGSIKPMHLLYGAVAAVVIFSVVSGAIRWAHGPRPNPRRSAA